jgi:hypothetical protein
MITNAAIGTPGATPSTCVTTIEPEPLFHGHGHAMPAKTPGLFRHGPALRLTQHRHFDTYFREYHGPG